MERSLHPELIRARIMDCGQVMIYRYIDERTKQLLGFRNDFDLSAEGHLLFRLNECFANKYAPDAALIECFFYKKGKPYYITAKGLTVQANKEIIEKALQKQPGKVIYVQIDSVELIELGTKRNKAVLRMNADNLSVAAV